MFLNAIEHSQVSATVTQGSSATHLIPIPGIQKISVILFKSLSKLSFELAPDKIG